MSHRLPMHHPHVLCPALAGTHYFAIIGAAGYAHGILARTLKGFLHTATRLALSEGFDKVVSMAPARINVVSLDRESLGRLEHDYRNAELDRVRDRVGRSLRGLLKAKDPIPEGFEVMRKPRTDEFRRLTPKGHVIVRVPGDKGDRFRVADALRAAEDLYHLGAGSVVADTAAEALEPLMPYLERLGAILEAGFRVLSVSDSGERGSLLVSPTLDALVAANP